MCLCLLFPAMSLFAGVESFISPALPAAQLADRLPADDRYLIIDLRTAAEYRVGHIPGAMNLPPMALEQHLDALRQADTVVLYCIVGKRTREAEQRLMAHELDNLVHLQGGFGLWIRHGYDIEKGPYRAP